MLKAEKLCLRLSGNAPAVFENISFHLDRGETGYLAGPAGSGKTLLGLTLCGYLPLWVGLWELEGRIELFGKPVEQGSKTSEAGVILENPYTQLSGLKRSVFHELAFPLECSGIKPCEMPSRIEHYAGLFDVSHLLARNIRTLSGGELQRVLFAGTLMTQPRFLFLDRPFTEIDSDFRPKLMSIINEQVRRTDSAALIAEDQWLLPARNFNCEVHLGPESEEPEWPISSEPVNLEREPSISGDVLLSVENISFGYEIDHPVLSELSFSLGSGDIVIVEGPNGAGKTTLARLITGILTPTAGDIILDRRSIRSMEEWEIMSTVGLSLQDPGLHLCRKTVGEELELARTWGNDPGKFVELLGLEELIDNHPLELTQAEKKRLGMALACGERRKLLILDEPTQYQDSKGFVRMVEATRVHADEGRAVIIITHDPRIFRAFPDAGVIRLEQALFHTN